MMRQLAGQSKLNFPVFQHVQEHDFGITLADIVPALTGEREKPCYPVGCSTAPDLC